MNPTSHVLPRQMCLRILLFFVQAAYTDMNTCISASKIDTFSFLGKGVFSAVLLSQLHVPSDIAVSGENQNFFFEIIIINIINLDKLIFHI